MQGNESLHHLDRKLSIFTYRGYGRRNSGDPPLKTGKTKIDPFAPLDQNGTKRTTIIFTVLIADMVLKKEAPGKNGKKESIFAVFTLDMVEEKGAPPGKHDKTITCLMFTVFTADMLEKKGVPPPGETVKKKMFDFYRFYREYGRRKRGAPHGETVEKENVRFLPFLPRIW